MSISAPAAIPTAAPNVPAPPPGGDTEKSTDVEATSTEIDKAGEEGRLSIRAADLAPKIIEALAVKYGPDKIVAKIEECLNATKTMAIGGKPFETSDYKTRLDALKLLLQYQVGMPVARSETIVHNVDTIQTLETKMQKSPALRRAVGRMLDRAKIEEGEIVETQAEVVSEADAKEAEEVLQEAPEQPETPVETEVRTKAGGSMRDHLKSRGNMDTTVKYHR